MLQSLRYALSHGSPLSKRRSRRRSPQLLVVAAILPFMMSALPVALPFGIPLEGLIVGLGVLLILPVITIPLAMAAL